MGQLVPKGIDMRRLFPTLMLATALVAAGSPASAAQLDPREAPKVTGDVSDPARGCSKDVAKRKGRIAAVGLTCSHAYFLQGGSARAYMVVWQQTRVKARKGWCAKRVTSEITSGAQSRIEDVAPTSNMRTQRSRKRTVKYQTTAGNTLAEAATFEQTFILRPRAILNSREMLAGGQEVARSEWRGSIRKAVAVVHAVEVSWSSTLSQPEISPVVDYRIKRQANC